MPHNLCDRSTEYLSLRVFKGINIISEEYQKIILNNKIERELREFYEIAQKVIEGDLSRDGICMWFWDSFDDFLGYITVPPVTVTP